MANRAYQRARAPKTHDLRAPFGRTTAWYPPSMDMAPDQDTDPKETTGWIESFDAVIREEARTRARDSCSRA